MTGRPSAGATPVLRFAPSPNGELHLGHALSALTGHDMARRRGGRFLLRIEDIDLGRARADFIRQIFDDLAWLGLTWERPVLVQSQHLDAYRAAADALARDGLLYPCFATRSEIADAVEALPARGNPAGAAAARDRAARDPDGALLYPGLHRNLPAGDIARRRARGEPYALRLDMAKALERADALLGGRPLEFVAFDAEGRESVSAADPARWGDAVIMRKDAPASYHLSVVVDDARQGVTHVTRGEDLLAATGLHRLLQVLLGLPAPRYHHHRLITDGSGRKLSKSARDTSLRSLREAGVTPAAVRAMLNAPDAP